MSQGYTVLGQPKAEVDAASSDFALDVLVGLSGSPKRLSSKHFYDSEGSNLFARITDTEDYYPTRKEFEIFENHGESLLEAVRGQSINLVDLGAGDGRKTAVLISHLRRMGCDLRYVPIDISEGAMVGLVDSMRSRFDGLEVAGIVGDYFEGIRWLGRQSDRRNLVLFLGSNIGNFDKAQSRAFLHRLWNAFGAGDLLLIGFDLKKDIEALLAAYNDSEGVTRDFNLNLLTRINRELGADFDTSRFRHFSTYNVISGAMESYLVSLEGQTVQIDGLRASFSFDPWEAIHTEYSYKYLESDIREMAAFTGFEILQQHHDSQGWFCDALWQALKRKD